MQPADTLDEEKARLKRKKERKKKRIQKKKRVPWIILNKKLCVSLTDDPSRSTHMLLHALVTRPPRCPDPATALAGDRVTWSRERPPQGTLTLLTATARHPRVTMVTSRTPGQGDHGKMERVKNSVACNQRFTLLLLETANK